MSVRARSPRRMAALVIGVIMGGGAGIAIGAAIGAGIGVVVGAVWDGPRLGR